MAIYPGAVYRPISRNYGGVRRSTRAVVLHVDAGGAESLHGWFNNPASQASSQFYVKYDGTVEQYMDSDRVAWTQREGNATCVGIETQGKGDGAWTEAQMQALENLVRWLCDHYGLPKVDMVNSRPSSRGIGMHRYGIAPWRVAGGQTWGPAGKVCPGNRRVEQFPTLVSRVKNGSSKAEPESQEPEDEDMMVIYRAGSNLPLGVLAHNGGWVILRSAEEKKNLLAAGAKEVWVEEPTLVNLINDARGANSPILAEVRRALAEGV